jgi:hypothetical protein
MTAPGYNRLAIAGVVAGVAVAALAVVAYAGLRKRADHADKMAEVLSDLAAEQLHRRGEVLLLTLVRKDGAPDDVVSVRRLPYERVEADYGVVADNP